VLIIRWRVRSEAVSRKGSGCSEVGRIGFAVTMARATFILVAAFLFLASLSVLLASSSSDASAVQKCVAKVQKSMDCILSSHNKWVDGKFIEYKAIKTLAKSNWENCNRPVQHYVWNHSTTCSKAKVKTAYSRDEMCRIVSGKTIMIVGDSISNQFFLTFASALWPLTANGSDFHATHFDKHLFKDKNGTVLLDYRDSGYNDVMISIPCTDMKHGFKLIFVRNYNLTTNSEVPDDYFIGGGHMAKDIPRAWLDRVGNLFIVADSNLLLCKFCYWK
jgi:preprotein translocase subunit SecG